MNTYKFVHYTSNMQEKLPLPIQMLWAINPEETAKIMVATAKKIESDCPMSEKNHYNLTGITLKNAIRGFVVTPLEMGEFDAAILVNQKTASIMLVTPNLYPCVHAWELENPVHPDAIPLLVDLAEEYKNNLTKEILEPVSQFAPFTYS